MSERNIFERAWHHRVIKFSIVYIVIIASSIVIGMLGYRLTEGYSWLDCFLNTAMLMGGMGQINDLKTGIGRAFAGAFSLYCGTFEILSLAVVLSPLAKWFLHFLRVEEPIKEEEQKQKERDEKKDERQESRLARD